MICSHPLKAWSNQLGINLFCFSLPVLEMLKSQELKSAAISRFNFSVWWFNFTVWRRSNVLTVGVCVLNSRRAHPSHGGLRRPSTSVSTWYSMSARVCSVTANQPMSLIWRERKQKNNHRRLDNSSVDVSIRFVKSSGRGGESLTGWYLMSFGGYLKWGPKLTETWKEAEKLEN